MLVLTRRFGEAIVINERVVVRVLCLKGGRIRLGVEAPAGDKIRRAELAPMAKTLATRREHDHA